MFCNKCGNQVNDGAVFCNKCGNRFGAAPASAPGANQFNIPTVGAGARGVVSFVKAKLKNPLVVIVSVVLVIVLLACLLIIPQAIKKKNIEDIQTRLDGFASSLVKGNSAGYWHSDATHIISNLDQLDDFLSSGIGGSKYGSAINGVIGVIRSTDLLKINITAQEDDIVFNKGIATVDAECSFSLAGQVLGVIDAVFIMKKDEGVWCIESIDFA